MQTIKVGISACLLGDEVRFDGGHKRSAFCTDELGRHVEFVKLCPEVGIGMSVPRPTIRLEQREQGGSAGVPKTGRCNRAFGRLRNTRPGAFSGG